VPAQSRSWLSLWSFCLLRAIAVALGFAIVVIGGTLTLAGGQAPNIPRKNLRSQSSTALSRAFSGVVTDSECGARHNKDATMSSAECARFCLRHGAKYMLVDGERSYVLNGNADQFAKLAGQRVRIAGVQNGDAIQVSSVSLP
jgi:hypothetical protein